MTDAAVPGSDDRSSAAKTAYPTALRDAEHRRWAMGLAARFQKLDDEVRAPQPPRQPSIGVALSGGGIRSATFSLGVFQAFAGKHFLRHIDFISTISGGGYFGSFLGRLFSRDYVRNPSDVESVLLQAGTARDGDSPELPKSRRNVIWWLRENGRYLSPRGAGDQLLFLAVLFRNLFALNVVIALPVVAFTVLMQFPRLWSRFNTLPVNLPGGDLIWWSPWMATALIPLAIVPAVVWAYFLRDDRDRAVIASAAAAAVVATVVVLGYTPYRILWVWKNSALAPWLGALMVTFLVALALGSRFLADRRPPEQAANLLAQWLRALLAMSAMLLCAGVLDSLGQTAYFQFADGKLGAWLVAVGAGLGTAGAFARQITVLLGPKASGERPRFSLTLIGTVGAIVLILVLGTTYSAIAHAVAWDLRKPAWTPEQKTESVVKVEAPSTVSFAVIASPGQAAKAGEKNSRMEWLHLLGWLTAIATLAWGFGQQWRFINYSTQQPLYSARLARAYLGASNPERWKDTEKVPVIEPLPTDDASMNQYWPPLEDKAAAKFEKGAPLHFVSVTINATVGGRSQIEQRDRKGLGFAIGPAGLSVGVRNHAVFTEEYERAEVPDEWKLLRRLKLWGNKEAPPPQYHATPRRLVVPEKVWDYSSFFNALDYGQHDHEKPVPFNGERLSLSLWTGLSGAAFSTGIGNRTSLGLSLLTGFLNVRLGYWWEAGARPPKSPRAVSITQWCGHQIGRFFQTFLPVHRYIADEFLARFPGVSRRRWYLSDGGHFENLGAYELIRRRVPLAILIDAGEDGGALFDDLGNLVRKARMDFNAEIKFADKAALDRVRDVLYRSQKSRWDVIGELQDLRPECSKVEDCEKEAGTERPYSKAYATLAVVQYDSPNPCDGSKHRTFILYVKPGLMRNEAADLINYARQRHAFPHESTADQFFDEAQWESYRKLGETIMCRVSDELQLQDPSELLRALQAI